MAAIYMALKGFARVNSRFPERLSQLVPKYQPDPTVFMHPAWPEQPGYAYVTGIRLSGEKADPPATILLFENVPAKKKKLDRLVLMLNGEIHLLSPAEFEKRIAEQAEAWQKDKREWLIQVSSLDDKNAK
ncbi:MAG TPA: hypothetical protein VEK08_15340 [Planctomycetota bacterium]|nr:hypothetical protein [Planctomycetota bacterium]